MDKAHIRIGPCVCISQFLQNKYQSFRYKIISMAGESDTCYINRSRMLLDNDFYVISSAE